MLNVINPNITLQKLPKIELRKKPSKPIGIQLNDTDDSVKYIRKMYNGDIELYESAFIIMLDTANQIIGYARISQGALTATTVDIRLIALYCVLANARSCIFAHNHPSGNLTASEEDVRISTRMKSALALFDIQLLDSIIITSEGFSRVSFS